MKQSRYWPFYFLVQCSDEIAGAALASLQQGMDYFVQEICSDSYARQVVELGFITFGGKNSSFFSNDLVAVTDFTFPRLESLGAGVPLGKALMQVYEHLLVPKHSLERIARPLIFIILADEPSDDWLTPRQKILDLYDEFHERTDIGRIVAIGCGGGISRQTLAAIGLGASFKLGEDVEDFRDFFNDPDD